MDKHSYTSADVDIPVKILHDLELIESMIKYKHIILRHLQLSVTNKCNLNCIYCACKDADRTLELDLGRVYIILDKTVEVGCKAITITGGGEPLLYPKINEVINYCDLQGISVGLVTNGIALEKLEREIGWCRISFDSHRIFSTRFSNRIEQTIKKFPNIDWSFSFVLTNEGAQKDFGDLKTLVKFANAHNFTHIRVVSNLFTPTKSIIEQARFVLQGLSEKVIYQGRLKPTRGSKKCWISLLKPIIGTDGKIYPCCGVQYAKKNSKRDFVPRMSMGRGEDIVSIIERQDCFDGSACDICYYEGYNKILSLLPEDIVHKEWL